MKYIRGILLMISLILTCVLYATPYSPSPVGTAIEKVEKTKAEKRADRKVDRAIKKELKKQKNQQKRFNKFKKKLTKFKEKLAKKKFFGGVSDEPNFRLGILLILGGLALAIVGGILGIGLFNLVGGIAGLVGIVLIILAIVDYSS